MKGISLRPDFHAQREAVMTSIARACLSIARRVKDKYAKDGWPDDRIAELVTRAAQPPTTTTSALALRQIAMHFVASLVPVSAAAAVISRSLQLNFDQAGQISVPALTLPHAAWVGESMPIPVVQGTTTPGALLDLYKLATIVSLSGEMIRNANAEAFVRQVLIEIRRPDARRRAVFGERGGAWCFAGRHSQLLAPLTPTAGGGLAALATDVKALATALAPVAGGGPAVTVAAPAQAAALTLQTPRDFWPVYACAALTAGTVIALVPAALATAVEVPRVDKGENAVLHMNDAPTDISTSGSAVAFPTKSMFQLDAVALRLILPASWARRSASGVAWLQNVTW